MLLRVGVQLTEETVVAYTALVVPWTNVLGGECKVFKWTHLENAFAQFISIAGSACIRNVNKTVCRRGTQR